MSERRGDEDSSLSWVKDKQSRKIYASAGSSSYHRQRNAHSVRSENSSRSWVQDKQANLLNSRKRIVNLPSSLKEYYEESKAIKLGSIWLKEVGGDIQTRVKNARLDGAFAKTNFEYSVFLLGSMCLQGSKSDESLIEELYRNGFNKVHHGVFGTKPIEFKKGDMISQKDCVFVANELANLFNNKPDLRKKIRREWLQSKADGKPHDGGKFTATLIIEECAFLIREYIKHAPELGLTVQQYVELTSTLFDHCDPVSCFGEINQMQNFAIVIPENPNPSLMPKLQNTFTKSELSARLLSPPNPSDPIPNKVICRCNASHVCMLTEIRYLFEWEGKNLVNNIPSVVNIRIDLCEKSADPHSLSYFTQKDRLDILNVIKNNPSYGYYENMGNIPQPCKLASAQPPNQPDDEGFEVVIRKRKGKGKG